jgi:hypothetical protein
VIALIPIPVKIFLVIDVQTTQLRPQIASRCIPKAYSWRVTMALVNGMLVFRYLGTLYRLPAP